MSYLIIFTGESNSEGVANSGLLSAAELMPRSEVQILNNSTLNSFSTLQIKVNNQFGYSDPPTVNRHGWENGLANLAGNGSLLPTPIYLVKAGKDGSKIDQWGLGSTNLTNYTNRVDAAKTLLANKIYKPVIWYSQGINDVTGSTNLVTWKAATIQHFNRIRSVIGTKNTPILMTSLTPAFNGNGWGAAIQDVVAQVPSTYFVNTADIGADADLADISHWNATGMKLIAAEMVRLTKAVVSTGYRSRTLPTFKPNFKVGGFRQ